MRAKADAARRNGDDTREGLLSGTSVQACFACGSPLTPRRYREVEAKRGEFIEQIRATLILERDAEIEQIRIEAAAQVAKTKADVAEREAAIRKDAATTATAALMDKITKTEQARKAAEQQIKNLKADQDAALKARLEAERETAAKKLAEAVTAEKVKAFEEKTKLTEQLGEMQRRLEKKTAHELGNPAEVDLFAALEKAFPDDRIARVRRGTKGPDVIMEVIHQGAPVGSIALDSKNHARWSHAFTRKLRTDQLAWGSDWAILSTATMPAGARQLHIQDGVIVADPARVVVLAHLLRRQILENHRLKLSTEARDEKGERLLAYITSPTCTDLLDRIVKLTGDMTSLDRLETAAHQKTWSKRTDLIRSLQSIHEEFSTTVSAIISGESS